MSTDADRARALEKIKKLLAMGKDGRGNIHEAETALRQAEALMRKYNIDESEAITKELNASADAITTRWCKAGLRVSKRSFHASVPIWANFLSVGVGAMCECRTSLAVTKEGGMGILFGGYVVDVGMAVWTFEYLLDNVREASLKFQDALDSGDAATLAEFGIDSPQAAIHLMGLNYRERGNAFRVGMASRLQRRMLALAAQRKWQFQEAATAGDNRGNQLMVLKDQLIEKQLGKDAKKKETRPNTASDVARYAGDRAGERTNLTPNPIGATGGKLYLG